MKWIKSESVFYCFFYIMLYRKELQRAGQNYAYMYRVVQTLYCCMNAVHSIIHLMKDWDLMVYHPWDDKTLYLKKIEMFRWA